MEPITCQNCGRVVLAPAHARSVRCTGCGQPIDLESRRRIRAVEDLGAYVRRASKLPRGLCNQIRALVKDELEVLSEKARKKEPAEDASPRPAMPPPLPIRDEHPQPERRTSARKKKPERRGPTIWERLGPAFAENLGFGLAAFLIVAGAVYFTTTAWTTMTGAQRLLVVVGGLAVLGSFLYGAGRLLNRGGTLPEVERVLLLVTGFLLPIAAVPAGELLWLAPTLGLLGVGLVLPPGFLAARALARVLDPALSPFLPTTFTFLSALVLLGPVATEQPILTAACGAVLFLAAVMFYVRRVLPRTVTARTVLLWPPFLLGFSLAVAVGRAALEAAGPHPTGEVLASLGITLSAFGAALVLLENALFARGVFGKRRSTFLLVMALALGVTGTVVALGNEVGLLLASAIGAFAALRAAWGLPVPWLAVPGLVLAALAYLESPAPIRQTLLHLRDQAAHALGYVNRPLPLAYYGLTFLPYVAACGLWAWWLLQKEQTARARVLIVWTFASALGLTALSLLTSGSPPFSDLRAPAGVLAAQGALLLTFGIATRHRWFAFTGVIGLYAGALCVLIHLEVVRPFALLMLSSLGFLAISAAGRLAGSVWAFAKETRAALLDATVLLAVVLAMAGVYDILEHPVRVGPHALGYVALAVLFGVLGSAYRCPMGLLFAGGALAGAVACFLSGVAPHAAVDVHLLVFGAISALVLFAPLLESRVPAALCHPYAKRDGDPVAWVPGTVLLIQLFGWRAILDAAPPCGWTFLLAAGFLVGAAVFFVAALRYRRNWLTVFAVLEMLGAGLAVVGTLGGRVEGTAGLLGVAGALVVVYVPVFVRLARRRSVAFARFLFEILFLLAVLFLPCTILIQGVLIADQGAVGSGVELTVACLLVAGLVRFAYGWASRRGVRTIGGVAAGLLFMPAACGLLHATRAPVDVVPLGFIAATVATFLWAGRWGVLRAVAGVHLLVSFVVTVGVAVSGSGDPWLLLVAFVLLAASGRGIAIRAPVTGGVLFLLSILLGSSFVVLERLVPVDRSYQVAVWILFSAFAWAASRLPLLGVPRIAAQVVSMAILGTASGFALVVAVRVACVEPLLHDSLLDGNLGAARLAAGAFVLAVFVWSRAAKPVARCVLPVVALALATFVAAPVNILLNGSDVHLWRPDVEVGLLAFLLALVLPRHPKLGSTEEARLGPAVAWPLGLAGAALLLTAGDLGHPGTPLTAFTATLVVLVLLVRDRRPGWGRLLGLGGFATALAAVAWARPYLGPVARETPLLYGATSALVAPLLALLAGTIARREGPPWRSRAGRELVHVAVCAAVTAFGFVMAGVVAFAGTPAGPWAIALAAVALGVPGGAAAFGATRLRRPALVHVSVVGVLVFYGFLAVRTNHLAGLDGYHLHALVVIGATLLFLAPFHRSRLGFWLALDGALLSVPAILYFAPVALGAPGDPARAASALALAGVVCASAAQRLRAPGLGWVAVALLNLVLFAFWRRHELVDPSFYGVPPGLTLTGAAVVLRGRIPRVTRLALLVPGLALLYGSVGLQVLRVGDPVHALVFLGMGLGTVALGFWLRRNAWLVLGMTVVVLDVVLHLATHGFETGFFGAALLVGAGLSVLAVVGLATHRRRREQAHVTHDEAPVSQLAADPSDAPGGADGRPSDGS